MASIKENNLELNYGWPYGESGWNSGMDENIVKLGFESRKRVNGILSSPPPSPSNGDAYIVGTAPTGLFSGKFANIAIYDRGSWVFIKPKSQEVVFNTSDGCYYIYNNVWSLKLEAEVSPYIKIKDFDFSTGYTITDSRQLLFYPTNQTYYQWSGALPKVVPAGSTPATTGGIGAGAWVSVGDVHSGVEERLLGVGVKIYRGSNGWYVQNGDVVPVGTTHLAVLINGKAEDVVMSPVSSGSVSLLVETSAIIGGVPVNFIAINDHNQQLNRDQDDCHPATAIITTSGNNVQQEIDSVSSRLDLNDTKNSIQDSRLTDNESAISALQAAQSLSIVGYPTRAELFADLAHQEGTTGFVGLDTTESFNGFYQKLGGSGAGSWVYINSTIPNGTITNEKLSNNFMFRGEVANGTDLNTLKIDGVHFLNGTYTYVNIVPELSRTACAIYVNKMAEITGNPYYHQVIKPFANPHNIYSRQVTPTSGTNWVKSFQNQYMLTRGLLPNNSSAQAANEDGVYFLKSSNTYTDIPTACVGVDCLLEVVEAFTPLQGRFKRQRISFSGTPNTAWVRRVDLNGAATQSWTPETASPSSVGRNQLSSVYSDLGDLSSGSANNVIGKEGNYLILNVNSVADLPNCGATAGILSTKVTSGNGGWGIQEFVDLLDGGNRHTRMTRISNNTVTAWSGKPASDKIIACFGDSITEFGTYPEQLGKILGAKTLKMGFSGCRMANHSDQYYNELSMCNMAETIASGDFTNFLAAIDYIKNNYGDNDQVAGNLVASVDWNTVDYVTIFFGTNDYGAATPIGLDSDTDGTTFKGGVNKTITKLLGAYPHLKLMFITPIWRPRINVGDGLESDNNPNSNGDFLIQFADSIIDRCDSNHIESTDFYRKSGFGPLTQSVLLRPGDDIHPSNEGYKVIAEKVGASFRSKFGK